MAQLDPVQAEREFLRLQVQLQSSERERLRTEAAERSHADFLKAEERKKLVAVRDAVDALLDDWDRTKGNLISVTKTQAARKAWQRLERSSAFYRQSVSPECGDR